VSTELFQWFKERIPPKERTDWQNRLGLETYDELEVIKKTGLRLVEDTYYLERA